MINTYLDDVDPDDDFYRVSGWCTGVHQYWSRSKRVHLIDLECPLEVANRLPCLLLWVSRTFASVQGKCLYQICKLIEGFFQFTTVKHHAFVIIILIFVIIILVILGLVFIWKGFVVSRPPVRV